MTATFPAVENERERGPLTETLGLFTALEISRGLGSQSALHLALKDAGRGLADPSRPNTA